MNVTNLANLYRSLQTTTAAPVDTVQKGLEKASTRLDTEKQSNAVQLSSYGQVKSGFARIEDAGKALAKADTLSPADTKKALQAMVSAYNDTRSAASATTPGYASNAANSLRRAASSSSMRSDMQALGITQKSDGSLSLDTQKLDQSMAANLNTVKDAASRVSGQLQQSATSALRENGGINRMLNSLNARAQQIEGRQSGLQGLASSMQSSSSSSSGIDSYMRIFSM